MGSHCVSLSSQYHCFLNQHILCVLKFSLLLRYLHQKGFRERQSECSYYETYRRCVTFGFVCSYKTLAEITEEWCRSAGVKETMSCFSLLFLLLKKNSIWKPAAASAAGSSRTEAGIIKTVLLAHKQNNTQLYLQVKGSSNVFYFIRKCDVL